MFKKTLIMCAGALLMVSFGVAQQQKKVEAKKPATDSTTMTLQGYVVDAMCAKGMAGKETTMKKAAGHTKDCALEKECAASGYGIFSDSKWFKFDAAGDKQAKQSIEKSSREKELSFEVTGTMAGDKFAVASMKEIKLQKSEKKLEKKAVEKEALKD